MKTVEKSASILVYKQTSYLFIFLKLGEILRVVLTSFIKIDPELLTNF